MVSARILRSHSFFNLLSKEQFAALGEIAGLEKYARGEQIFEEGQLAEKFYFLHDGGVELFCTLFHSYHPEKRKQCKVGEVTPGQPFGISALIPPFILTSTACATADSEVIRFDASALQRLLEEDMELANLLFDQLTRAAMKRLHATRLNLLQAYSQTDPHPAHP